MKVITKDTLKKWNACSEGYARFNELFPKGATLAVASQGLVNDGHPSWSSWLWSRCKEDADYVDQTSVTAGDRGTATAGDFGTATAGHRGTATAGYSGTAKAGDFGTATAGHRGTATAGYSGTAKAGEYGVICLLWWNGNLYVRKAAEVDGKKIKPNVAYKLDDKGRFIEATKA